MNGFHQMNNNTMLEILNKCGAPAFAVYSVLLMRRNTQTGLCFPSHKTIAEDSGMGVSTVRRHLESLKKEGFLEWTVGGFDKESGINKANTYIFLKL